MTYLLMLPTGACSLLKKPLNKSNKTNVLTMTHADNAMISTNPLTLVDPQSGNLALKLVDFSNNSGFDHLQRHNYFSIIWIKQGLASLKADFSEYAVGGGTMLFFAPYQPFLLASSGELLGSALYFHSDFFCIFRHQADIESNGVLFNNVYQPPYVTVDSPAILTFDNLLVQIRVEMQRPALSQYELLVSYLKILLIQATRLKVDQTPNLQLEASSSDEPFVLHRLKGSIETHFRSKHTPGDYADLLSLTPKALGKITKKHFKKTLTDLIAERIVVEAKRELYLTGKPVKSIAHELGFGDEYHFSRFFKNHTDVSPQRYRTTVGFGRQTALLS